MSQQTFTAERALNILGGRKVITSAGTFPEPIIVGNVITQKRMKDANGEFVLDSKGDYVREPMYWDNPETGEPDLTRPYYSVVLNAYTQADDEEANRLFDEEEFDQAVNINTFSLRMSPEEVAKAHLAKGSIVSATFDIIEVLDANEELVDRLVCRGIAPMIAKGGSSKLADRKRALKLSRTHQTTSSNDNQA